MDMDMDEYLTFAKELALSAGEIMAEHFNIFGVSSESKGNFQPVTVADKAINDLVIDAVIAAYPDHGVLGEEASKNTEASYLWVCDPIDGTIPFANGIPNSMFSLALTYNGKPIVAVLYDPYMQRLFEAVENGQTFLNGRPVNVNNSDTFEEQHLAIVGGTAEGWLVDSPKLIESISACGGICTAFFCSTYESSLIITGCYVGHVYQATHPWDIAAVKLLIEGAGGKVTDLKGNSQLYNTSIFGAIVSNGAVHKQLVELVAPHILSVKKSK